MQKYNIIWEDILPDIQHHIVSAMDNGTRLAFSWTSRSCHTQWRFKNPVGELPHRFIIDWLAVDAPLEYLTPCLDEVSDPDAADELFERFARWAVQLNKSNRFAVIEPYYRRTLQCLNNSKVLALYTECIEADDVPLFERFTAEFPRPFLTEPDRSYLFKLAAHKEKIAFFPAFLKLPAYCNTTGETLPCLGRLKLLETLVIATIVNPWWHITVDWPAIAESNQVFKATFASAWEIFNGDYAVARLTKLACTSRMVHICWIGTLHCFFKRFSVAQQNEFRRRVTHMRSISLFTDEGLEKTDALRFANAVQQFLDMGYRLHCVEAQSVNVTAGDGDCLYIPAVDLILHPKTTLFCQWAVAQGYFDVRRDPPGELRRRLYVGLKSYLSYRHFEDPVKVIRKWLAKQSFDGHEALADAFEDVFNNPRFRVYSTFKGVCNRILQDFFAKVVSKFYMLRERVQAVRDRVLTGVRGLQWPGSPPAGYYRV